MVMSIFFSHARAGTESKASSLSLSSRIAPLSILRQATLQPSAIARFESKRDSIRDGQKRSSARASELRTSVVQVFVVDSNHKENRLTILAKSNDPNDFVATLKITEDQSSMQVACFNMLGKKVKVIHEGFVKSVDDGQNFDFNASDLPQGMYLCVAQGNGIRLVEKFYVNR